MYETAFAEALHAERLPKEAAAVLDELIAKLGQNFDIKVRKFEGVEENVQFKLPPEITEARSEADSLTGGG